MDDFDLDDFLPFRLAVLAGQVSREFSARYHERFGIGRQEWRVVAHLANAGPSSVREIHQQVDMDKSRVSRAASRLEASGHVRKEEHPTDGRLVRLSLTPSGEAMMTELSAMADAYQSELLARLGDRAEAFSAGLSLLGDAMG
ncbi:DNA-binding MarR family transcriptional regulator [Aliiruegeria haliotis]|uniref:DNA-binding MarR family transcriptional regulator n=1 Tax=Aliiruegeria haliotis TaxID=1280846 RepID=A0A2T0RJ75_9RHOB|nr:MarR family winged helix-turn-helix transcriptional regulator [Aliiruegeria haliotis]PRY21233.1 DNA-binding MarR family transcriptional regulator [Aliiruegeria haliotis]